MKRFIVQGTLNDWLAYKSSRLHYDTSEPELSVNESCEEVSQNWSFPPHYDVNLYIRLVLIGCFGKSFIGNPEEIYLKLTNVPLTAPAARQRGMKV